jgi:hypothetical protein
MDICILTKLRMMPNEGFWLPGPPSYGWSTVMLAGVAMRSIHRSRVLSLFVQVGISALRAKLCTAA